MKCGAWSLTGRPIPGLYSMDNTVSQSMAISSTCDGIYQ